MCRKKGQAYWYLFAGESGLFGGLFVLVMLCGLCWTVGASKGKVSRFSRRWDPSRYTPWASRRLPHHLWVGSCSSGRLLHAYSPNLFFSCAGKRVPSPVALSLPRVTQVLRASRANEGIPNLPRASAAPFHPKELWNSADVVGGLATRTPRVVPMKPPEVWSARLDPRLKRVKRWWPGLS